MHRIIGTALALALLAGCSSKSGGSNSSAGAAAGGQEEQEPANLTESQTNMAIPVPAPSPSPIAAIPSSFHGRWAMVASDCAAGGAGDAKGLMTVSADRLSFPGVAGGATNLHQLTPQALALDQPMSEGGKSWTEQVRLTLQDGGRALIRQASGGDRQAGAFTYQRCPA